MIAMDMYAKTAGITRAADAPKRMKVGKSAQDLNCQDAEVMQIMTKRCRMKGYDPKERYARLKALAICTCCGKNPAMPGVQLCEVCRYKYKQYQKEKAYKPEKPKKVIPKYTLEEVSKMAFERGISYGQMVALLERGENNGTKK